MERIRQERSPLTRPSGHGIDLRAGTTPQLIDSLLRGKLHAVFGEQPGFHEDLWTRPLAKEGFCLCISKNHPFARKPDVQIKQLDGEMLFLIPRTANPKFYDQTLEYIESTGARPRMREVLSCTHAVEIVSNDLGSALLSSDKLLGIETTFCRRRDSSDDRIQVFRYVAPTPEHASDDHLDGREEAYSHLRLGVMSFLRCYTILTGIENNPRQGKSHSARMINVVVARDGIEPTDT